VIRRAGLNSAIYLHLVAKLRKSGANFYFLNMPSRCGQEHVYQPCFFYIMSIVPCTWNLRKVDRKYLECFEIWYRRRMEKFSWIDGVRSEEVLQSAKKDKNALQTIKTRKAHWIVHILHRNCFLKADSHIACRSPVIPCR